MRPSAASGRSGRSGPTARSASAASGWSRARRAAGLVWRRQRPMPASAPDVLGSREMTGALIAAHDAGRARDLAPRTGRPADRDGALALDAAQRLELAGGAAPLARPRLDVLEAHEPLLVDDEPGPIVRQSALRLADAPGHDRLEAVV